MTKLQDIIGINYLNTSEVTNMSWMFTNCKSLTSLDVNNFNTAKVTSMEGMFQECESLTSLDVSHFNTAKVTSMSQMFNRCRGLMILDLGNFNTANVTNMSSMFSTCTSLRSLDLSSFNTSKVTTMNWMFGSSYALQTIYVGDGWSTAAVSYSNNMFYYCTNLVGGKGTTYDSDHIDKAYAHIDGGPSNPGYFTRFVSLDDVLNVEGGNIHFETGGEYPWILAIDDDGTVCARSSNEGVANSLSTLTATVTVTVPGTSVIQVFKARGEGTTPVYDACTFAVDGNVAFSFGEALGNYWATNNSTLEVGTHTLTWTYSKDSSVNPEGDFFAVSQVYLYVPTSLRGDVDGNGVVGMDDLTALINYLVYGTSINMTGADTDLSGGVGMDDLTTLINYLVYNHW